MGPSSVDELVVDDLEDRLRGRQRFQDVRAHRPLFDARNERLGRASETSASSNATRTSRNASSTSASVTLPRPPRRSKIAPRRSLS